MTEETKVTETMSDYEQELEASMEHMNSCDDPTWVTLQEYKDNQTVLEVKVEGIVKSGVIVYVEETRGFIPASRLSLNYVEDLNDFLGKKLQVRIIEADEESKKLVLSARELLREAQQKEKEDKLAAIKVGDILTGTVESLQGYGAFIALENGLSGLVHISQIALKRIKSPAEVLSVGDKVTVKVIAIKDGKLSLSIKALLEKEDDEEPEAIDYDLPKSEEVTTSLGSLFANLKL
ncbi:MAG: S1 RNA-binding domain-containing protein [Lachnospiraceae bacterium]|jgi:small subunit ribosomal protein S1